MKILLSAVLALFLVACSEEAPKEAATTEPTAAVTQEVKSEAPKAVETNVVQETKEEVVKAVEDVTKEVEAVTSEVANDVKVAAVAAVAEVKKEVAKVAEVTKVTDTATKEVEIKTAEVKAEVPVAISSNGEAIYKVCSSCHGVNAEKSALGKSQVIKGWSADKIEAALNGYKDGTYGAAMKGIMKGQALKLTPEDTKAVSQYISKL